VNLIEAEERQAASGKPLDTSSVAALVNWEEVVVDSTSKQPIIKKFSHRRAQSSTSTLEAVLGNSNPNLNNSNHQSNSSLSNHPQLNSLSNNSTPLSAPLSALTPTTTNPIPSSKTKNNVVAAGTKLHSNVSYITPIGPTVVHCSAGCGRTGAYIGIDSILSGWNDAIDYNMESSTSANPRDPVIETFRELREQRVSMVQTLEQLALCYEAIVAHLSQL
jgi:hypothetical protein